MRLVAMHPTDPLSLVAFTSELYIHWVKFVLKLQINSAKRKMINLFKAF